MAEEKATEFQEISEAFDYNISRVRNLIRLYRALIVENEKSDEDSPEAIEERVVQDDVLRAALVLLYATMEAFLSTLWTWKLRNGGRVEITEHRMKKDGRGSFPKKRSKNHSKGSASEYVDFRTRLMSQNGIENTLLSMMMSEEEVKNYKFGPLKRLIKRRHKIAHTADRDYRNGKEPHDLMAIKIGPVENYIEEVEKFGAFVLESLKEKGVMALNKPHSL